jgi:hypothetical protein
MSRVSTFVPPARRPVITRPDSHPYLSDNSEVVDLVNLDGDGYNA